MVHEAYRFEPSPVHADIGSLLEAAAEDGIRRLALVHVQRDLRREPVRVHEAMAGAKTVEVTMPEPGATYEI